MALDEQLARFSEKWERTYDRVERPKRSDFTSDLDHAVALGFYALECDKRAKFDCKKIDANNERASNNMAIHVQAPKGTSGVRSIHDKAATNETMFRAIKDAREALSALLTQGEK